MNNCFELLKEYKNQYLSIGITQDGARQGAISVPWESTGHAFNMKLPDLYFTPEDIKNQEVIDELLYHKVVGCYIFTPLEDYSFLRNFKNLWDLSISEGENLRDLSFLGELNECGMLYLHKAHLDDLEEVYSSARRNKKNFFTAAMRCVALDDCIVEDYGTLFDGELRFSEFIVFQRENSDEGKKLKMGEKPFPANTFRYYEFKVKEKGE